jgi:methanogenic corrinoid protein MtbC1
VSVQDAGTGDGHAQHLVDRFVSAAAGMRPDEVQAVLDEIGTRGSFEATMDRYVFPALRALGVAWETGRVTVAAEHAASAAVARWIGAAFDAAGSGRPDVRPVIVGLPPGARHELGALAFATAARRAGMSVHHLGADLPAPDWIGAARAVDAAGAVIGVPTSGDAESARAVAGSLHEAIRGIPIAFGGDGARGLRGTVLSPELKQAIAELRQRLAAG